ncbi:MAG: hypothetical protein HOL85_17145 [Rhodospirillaceae bacterium]|jgi:hypothetical protein|nr:hypothetical protein [Rhodospirillaceae bacterium]
MQADNDETSIEVYPTHARLMIGAAGAAVVAWFALQLALKPPPPGAMGGLATHSVLFFALTAGFATMAVYLTYRLFRPSPVVIIDDTGISVRTAMSGNTFVAWEDIDWAKYPMRAGKLGIGLREGSEARKAKAGISDIFFPDRPHVVINRSLLGGQLIGIAAEIRRRIDEGGYGQPEA